MTVVLESPSVCPLPEVPDYPPQSWGEPIACDGAGIVIGSNTFIDCELSEDGPTAAALPSGEYVITFKGQCKITHLVSNKVTPSGPPERYPGARELTPELLLAAADLMERSGLYKGDLWFQARGVSRGSVSRTYQAGRPLCAWGAVLVAAGITNLDPRTSLDDLIWDEHRVLDNIAMFNDDPVRSKREVVEQLRHRARMLAKLQAA